MLPRFANSFSFLYKKYTLLETKVWLKVYCTIALKNKLKGQILRVENV